MVELAANKPAPPRSSGAECWFLQKEAMMTARQRGWIGDFRNQHESFFRSKVLNRSWENAYKMEVSRLYG